MSPMRSEKSPRRGSGQPKVTKQTRGQREHVFFKPRFRTPSVSQYCQYPVDEMFALRGMSQSIWPGAWDRAGVQ